MNEHDIRAWLEQAVIGELRGPANGPDEIVDEPAVRGRYIAGLLAPRGQSAFPEWYDDGDPQMREGDDGTADAPPPSVAATLLPSSLGLTCTVAPDAIAIQITVRWGRYERVEIRDDPYRKKDGSFRDVWQRHQMEATSDPIPLTPGKMLPPWVPCTEFPDVAVHGLFRQRDGHWIITLFLVNGQQEPKRNKDEAWVFQPELIVAAPDGAPIFYNRLQRSQTDATTTRERPDMDEQMLALLYRHDVEFAVGHGVSVAHDRAPGCTDRATRIWTVVMPAYEVPQTTPPTADDIPALGDLTLDMRVLAQVPTDDFAAHLYPLVAAYDAWITDNESLVAEATSRVANEEADHSPTDLAAHLPAARYALTRCRHTMQRIQAGIALLDQNEDAAAAFRFANEAMAQQRIHMLYSAAKRRDETATLATYDVPTNHAWRVFQLAFLLINLPSLTNLHHPDRASPVTASPDETASHIADLLWFPTGGGKTEAYLGLTAYTLAIRRLQGTVAGRRGDVGVAVLMRYTLRLLTLQQFQRATALICACDMLRRADRATWGGEPFRIGLWVGQRSTPNQVKDAVEAVRQHHSSGTTSGSGSPRQLTHCPWCGAPITLDSIKPELAERGRGRVITYCSDPLGTCPFSQRQAPGEGLPIMVVDEEIYRRLPALLIATVDKFAQMPWNGRTAMLFGQVDGYCERHGFHSPDIHDRGDHQANPRYQLPASRFTEHPPLRPPDLIIQDELHLISGPLGTLVGLYETAVDRLATWDVDGMRVRPKVVASTATVRRAHQQVHGLFLRQVDIFPPQGLDVRDNFFSRQREPSVAVPGRCYLGICTPGIRHKTALIHTSIAFLAAAQKLYDQHGAIVDPWMTLVGYFNSLRELAAMRRAVDDAVSNRLRKMDRRGLARRFLDPYRVKELTSRLNATDIPEILERLEQRFDPSTRTASASPSGGRGRRRAERTPGPLDVLLATNMISVGVDVARLGLMLVSGQPKATAEYIQATSRVGRHHPGLVCTVYNWTRPRDLSHYERFNHYHATFYQQVEALSVTPFSPRALDRGLSAVLVALTRLGALNFNANERAGAWDATHPIVHDAVEHLVARAAQVAGIECADLVRSGLQSRIDEWAAWKTRTVGATLGYQKAGSGTTTPLLEAPGHMDVWSLFTCLNSLRDVEPTVNLILEDGGMD